MLWVILGSGRARELGPLLLQKRMMALGRQWTAPGHFRTSPADWRAIAPVDNAEGRLASCERDVVGDDQLGETLQGERANLFSRYASFERQVDELSKQNVAVLGLAAEPCRDIAHGANRRVAGAIGKPDLA
jgi:hypothetical protein